MAGLNSDLADLDAPALRLHVAELRAKNGTLETRLAKFEDAERANSAERPNGESAAPGKDVFAIAAPEDPVFPMEILLMIAEHLEPGTAPFLNLARSCRALYTCLAPEHFSYFTLVDAYQITERAIRRGPSIASLPYGLGLVRTLDVLCEKEERELRIQGELVTACSNITHLNCSWEQLAWLMREKKSLVLRGLKGRRLEFNGQEAERPSQKRLFITGWPNPRAMDFFVDNCPKLAEVELDMSYDDGQPIDTLNPTFVFKIRKCSFPSMDFVRDLVEDYTCFAPEEIELSHSPHHHDILVYPWPADVA